MREQGAAAAMLVLGIESAADQCGCALADEGGVIAEARLALPRRHAEALAPQIRFVCQQAGVTLAEVDAVAVDHGPGLYTGLRAGLATAKATAAALGVPAVPVGSLEALAYGAAALARPGNLICSVLDARRGEVFHAWYHCPDPPPPPPTLTATAPSTTGSESALVPLTAPSVGAPEQLAAEIAGGAIAGRQAGEVLLVGDGAIRYAQILAARHVVIAGPEFRFPSPAAVALLGRERALAGGTIPPEQVDPLYLRAPDARPPTSP